MSERPNTPGRSRQVPAAAGTALAVTEYGDDMAPPLMLLHGIGSSGDSWWPVVDPLATRFRLLALDLRGHGAAAKPATGYLLPDYAADLEAVLTNLEIARPRLLGHSLGGLVALQWALRHGPRAPAIVVEDSPLRTEPGVLELFDGWQRLAALSPAAAADYYREEHPEWSAAECRRRAESITATAPGVFAELRADSAARLATGNVERFADLAGIRAPVLLVHGDPETGGMVPRADATRFVETVPGSVAVRLPGASHSIHRERPTDFLEVVVPFLANCAD